ncbi:hypothetical protein [Streptomyces alkaliterrae]|uniref:hypothetical protein n=1 Tax=Streptomyces alkaliterrae TaxID=2213162 RepID=UPI001E491B35|nr:hypothetical protein [Streptomyces alkaliterrae]
MRAFRGALGVVAAGALTLGMTNAPAHAAAGSATGGVAGPNAYVQRCTNLGNGDLCIDVTGKAGRRGTIGVGYWKRRGDSVHVRLGWQNTTGGKANWSRTVHGPLLPGMSTGTEKWGTYLARGCVFPLLEVVGRGNPTLKGREVCVPS